MLRAVSQTQPTAASVGAIAESEKGQPNGVATLDGSGKVPQSQLPPLQHDVGKATSDAEMTALAVTAPAICLREDFTPPHIFFLTQDPASTLANWTDTGPLGAGAANPTATIGLTAKNGVANTYMRSDGAPALDQSIAPTWTGPHKFNSGVDMAGGVASLNGVSTVANGVPAICAQANSAGHAATIPPTTLYAVPADKSGMYRVTAYAVVTQAATTSSTLPNIGIGWTDGDSSTALQANTVSSSNPANALGAFGNGSIVISAMAGTNISYLTSNYASAGTTPMHYAVHLKVEFLG